MHIKILTFIFIAVFLISCDRIVNLGNMPEHFPKDTETETDTNDIIDSGSDSGADSGPLD